MIDDRMNATTYVDSDGKSDALPDPEPGWGKVGAPYRSEYESGYWIEYQDWERPKTNEEIREETKFRRGGSTLSRILG